MVGGGEKDRVLKGIKTNWYKQRVGRRVGRRGGGDKPIYFRGTREDYQLIVVNIQSRVACKN